MSAWNKLVQQTYKDGKAKSNIYSLGDAMKDARKVYKKGKAVVQNVAEKIVRRKTLRTSKTKKNRGTRHRGTRRN